MEDTIVVEKAFFKKNRHWTDGGYNADNSFAR